jgi:hypothetical protein
VPPFWFETDRGYSQHHGITTGTAVLKSVADLAPAPTRLRPELAVLRNQVRDFVADEMAAGSFTPRVDAWLGGWDEQFTRKLGERGWLE